MLVELLLEQFEQRERVRRRAGEARQYVALAEAADLARIGLHHGVAERDLAVAADDDLVATADGNDGGGVEGFRHGRSPIGIRRGKGSPDDSKCGQRM